jgi:hypothetical protein
MTVADLDKVPGNEILFSCPERPRRHIAQPGEVLIVIGDEPILVYVVNYQSHENASLDRREREGSGEPVVGP